MKVTIRRALATTVAVEKQQVLHTVSVCVASIIQQAYCHLWLAPLYNIFPHYFRNGRIFEKSY